MPGKRRQKAGKVFAGKTWWQLKPDVFNALRQENERREIERRMQEEDNKRLMYVDPLDQRFSL